MLLGKTKVRRVQGMMEEKKERHLSRKVSEAVKKGSTTNCNRLFPIGFSSNSGKDKALFG
jgi:hypothetical protein